MSNPVPWGKKEKYSKMSSAENFAQSAKCSILPFYYLSVCLKPLDAWQTVQTLIKNHVVPHLIWVFNGCSDCLSVLRINMVHTDPAIVDDNDVVFYVPFNII